jgi:drug/metabolite transporter (DMT)-like permease
LTHHWGYVGAITSAIFFGMATTLNKIVLKDVHPLIVAGLIYFIAGIVLFCVRLSPLQNLVLSIMETPTKTETVIGRRDFEVLAFVILSGAVVAPFLFLYGLNETTAVNASLLSNTEALFTVFIAFLFLKERGTSKDYVGILLLIIGAIFLTTNAEFQKLSLTREVLGNALIVGACLFWGIDNNLSKLVSKKRDLVLLTAMKCFIGGCALLLLSISLKLNFQIPLFSIPYLFSVGAFSIGFSILLFLFALREIGSMKTGVIFSTSSFFGATFAFIMLRETFSPIQLMAGFTMLLGVYIIYKKGRQPQT